jgi:hypothetical protein
MFFLVTWYNTPNLKLSHYTQRRRLGGGEIRYSSCSFSTSALDEGEWLASRPGRALAPGKGSPYPLYRRLVGPIADTPNLPSANHNQNRHYDNDSYSDRNICIVISSQSWEIWGVKWNDYFVEICIQGLWPPNTGYLQTIAVIYLHLIMPFLYNIYFLLSEYIKKIKQYIRYAVGSILLCIYNILRNRMVKIKVYK